MVPLVIVKDVVDALSEKLHSPLVPLKTTFGRALSPVSGPLIVLPVVVAVKVMVFILGEMNENVAFECASQLPASDMVVSSVNVLPDAT